MYTSTDVKTYAEEALSFARSLPSPDDAPTPNEQRARHKSVTTARNIHADLWKAYNRLVNLERYLLPLTTYRDRLESLRDSLIDEYSDANAPSLYAALEVPLTAEQRSELAEYRTRPYQANLSRLRQLLASIDHWTCRDCSNIFQFPDGNGPVCPHCKSEHLTPPNFIDGLQRQPPFASIIPEGYSGPHGLLNVLLRIEELESRRGEVEPSIESNVDALASLKANPFQTKKIAA